MQVDYDKRHDCDNGQTYGYLELRVWQAPDFTEDSPALTPAFCKSRMDIMFSTMRRKLDADIRDVERIGRKDDRRHLDNVWEAHLCGHHIRLNAFTTTYTVGPELIDLIEECFNTLVAHLRLITV